MSPIFIILVLLFFLASAIYCKLFENLFDSVLKLLGVEQRQVLPNPPGPWRIPIIGMMPFLALNPQKVLQWLRKVYGNIFTIYLGNYRVVVLNDYHSVRSAFREDVFAGRPDLKMLEVRNRGVKKGLVCSEGRDWGEQRRFTVRQLRDLGLGKQTMEDLLLQELEELIAILEKQVGSPVNLRDRFSLAVLNALWKITSGIRFNQNDKQLTSILKKTGADLEETQYTGPLLFLPWLLKVAPGFTRWNDFMRSIKSVHEFLKLTIQAHKIKSSSRSDSPDFIDAYLNEIYKTQDPNSSFYKTKGEESLLIVLLDLFMAGSDTTNAALSWAFLYMILYPEVQDKVQSEIDLIIGDQTPQLGHKKRMIYTEAVIMEILRKCSLVPLGLFHSTLADTEFGGYFIKKDTVIIANLYNVHHDKTYWNDPETFRPERFIDTINKQLIKFEAFMPFSIGKRVCPGENLAKDELFLFFVGIMQKFKLRPHPDFPLPTEDPKIGVILSPKPYYVSLNKRL